MSFFGRCGLICRIKHMRERRNCATLSVEANRRIYRCAVAHPDNPTRAGPIDMLMAGLVAWNCHPVCIVRSNSASATLSSRLASLVVVGARFNPIGGRAGFPAFNAAKSQFSSRDGEIRGWENSSDLNSVYFALSEFSRDETNYFSTLGFVQKISSFRSLL